MNLLHLIADKRLCNVNKSKTVLIMLITLLILFVFVGCTNQQTKQMKLRTLSVQDLYPRALKKAQHWKPDAYLADIAVDVLAEEDYERELEISFGFQSPSEDKESLLIYYQENSDEPEEVIVNHAEPILVHNPITLNDWPLDSLNVLPIAQQNGGNEFLSSHPSTTTRINLYLERRPTAESPLKWRASYRSLSNTSEYIWIYLNPQTGKIIEIYRPPFH